MKTQFLTCMFAAVLSAGAAFAAPEQAAGQAQVPYTPFMLSLTSPLEVPFGDFDVGGLRVSILYGECQDFDGLDLGFVGRAKGHANGLQSCAVNVVDGDGMGLQGNWIVGFVKGRYDGFQVGGVNYAKTMQGLQIGLLFNGADYMQGLQIGLINVSRTMIGVQIGLVNVVQENDAPFLPIINASF